LLALFLKGAQDDSDVLVLAARLVKLLMALL
jgi:hypothetical protein